MSDETSKQGPAVRVPEHVVYRSFDAETVLLNLQTGQYHGLNATGGRMLEVLGETGDQQGAAERLAVEYGVPVVQIAADLDEFCRQLADRGLIELDDPAG